MSFPIILQHNSSEKYRVHKDITDLSTVEGVLKDGTSIVDPHFLIEGDYANLGNFNYLTVPAFHRKYYVRDINQFRTNLLDVECHSDVLSSDIETLSGQRAIIKRQSNMYNLLLNDGSINAYQNPHVIYMNYDKYFDEAVYVLLVAGLSTATNIRIITQPADCPLGGPGQTATFTVVAEGEGLTYQWKRATWETSIEVDIPGATSPTYSFVTDADSEDYAWRCKITNQYFATVYTEYAIVRFS